MVSFTHSTNYLIAGAILIKMNLKPSVTEEDKKRIVAEYDARCGPDIHDTHRVPNCASVDAPCFRHATCTDKECLHHQNPTDEEKLQVDTYAAELFWESFFPDFSLLILSSYLLRVSLQEQSHWRDLSVRQRTRQRLQPAGYALNAQTLLFRPSVSLLGN